MTVLVLLLLSAGFVKAAVEPSPGQPKLPQQISPVQSAISAPQTPPVDLATYVLQKGDDIEIKAYNITELNQTVRIRPDGRISLMLLNDVDAAGMTAKQLGELLSTGFARYYRNPRISIIVRSFSMLSVYVGGEVQRPGLIPLRGDITALQAVLEAEVSRKLLAQPLSCFSERATTARRKA